MKKPRNPFKNLTVFEWCLWSVSLVAIITSFFAVKNTDYATLAVSVLGVTSLIFAAKGDVFGLILMMTFSIIYSVISFLFGYYGETIIYVCMQLPISITSFISWLRHPSKNGAHEVKVGRLPPKYALVLAISAACVTTAFYFILRAFDTANLIVSTLSVCTSFTALFLMVLRVPAYAAAFMVNDVVLIVLWSFALTSSLNYLPMVVCFSIFLINDLYSFICWTLRRKRQLQSEDKAVED